MNRSTTGLACLLLTLLFAGFQPSVLSAQVRIQFVHNAPEPLLDTLDVYFDSTQVVNNLPFRGATPYQSFAADSNFTIYLAPSGSESIAQAIASFPNSFTVAGTTLLISITGVASPSQYAPNPNGRITALNLHVSGNARETPPNDFAAFVSFWNGATDVEAASITFPELNSALDDRFVHGDFTGYVGLEARPYTVIFEPADDTLARSIRTFNLDLTNRGGTANSVHLSGFRNPEANQDGPGLALLIIDADGRVEEQTIITVANEDDAVAQPGAFRVAGNFPNPFHGRTTLTFDLAQASRVRVDVFDALGRSVWTAPAHPFAAGRDHRIDLDATAWAPGLYLYRMVFETPTATHTAHGPLMVAR